MLKLKIYKKGKLSSNKTLTKLFIEAVSLLKVEKMEGVIEVNFVSPKKIQKINNDFRGRNMETDVLSFSYFEEKLPFEKLAGEILICEKVAREQTNSTFKEEINTLFVHGLLHIFGFDHQNAVEEERMEKMAKKILTKL